MSYNLSELIDVAVLEDFFDSFYKISGIKANLVDLDGQLIRTESEEIPKGWQKICMDFHRKHPETLERCLASDLELSKKLQSGEQFTQNKCLNGLVDLAAPINIDGKHLGNLFTGQFFLEKPEKLFFCKQAGRYGFEEEKYLKALAEVPVFEESYVQDALEFLSKLAALIMRMGQERQRYLELCKKYRVE